MKRYKVFRICVVSAESKQEALQKVRSNPAKYQEAEFAKEVEPAGWGGALRSQLLGGRK
jgi:hypothetical protein